jgi:DUF4097 and DUF4098 domain-containing protein YvlB
MIRRVKMTKRNATDLVRSSRKRMLNSADRRKALAVRANSLGIDIKPIDLDTEDRNHLRIRANNLGVDIKSIDVNEITISTVSKRGVRRLKQKSSAQVFLSPVRGVRVEKDNFSGQLTVKRVNDR